MFHNAILQQEHTDYQQHKQKGHGVEYGWNYKKFHPYSTLNSTTSITLITRWLTSRGGIMEFQTRIFIFF